MLGQRDGVSGRMPIRVRKQGDLYSATVTPPDADVEWSSPHPMSAQEVYNHLKGLGCHPVDIMDALHACDPDWGRRTPGFRT